MQMNYEKIIADAQKELLDLEAMLDIVETQAGKLKDKIAKAKVKIEAGVSTPAKPRRGKEKGLSAEERVRYLNKINKRFLKRTQKQQPY